jgi:hypothetical protein
MRQSDDDYLRQPSSIFAMDDLEIELYVAVRRHLLKGAARAGMARLVCLPSLDRPAWWVRIRKIENGSSTPDFEIETAKANRPLLSVRIRGSETITGINKIDLRRGHAPIDEGTAEQISSIWEQAIRASRYPPPPKDVIRLKTDGEIYIFDCDARGGYLAGQTHSPDSGSLSRELTEIAARLFEYAEAPSEKRDSLLPEIRKRLSNIGARQQRLLSP